MSTSSAIRELVLSEWMTLPEAAEYLEISRQAAGDAALRHDWPRRRLNNAVLLSRNAVAQYAEKRRPSGPRPKTPSLDG